MYIKYFKGWGTKEAENIFMHHTIPTPSDQQDKPYTVTKRLGKIFPLSNTGVDMWIVNEYNIKWLCDVTI